MSKETMKAVIVEGREKVGIREVARPEPLPGEVRIRIEYCLLCTWEQRIFSGKSSTPLPFVPGHEASGIIDCIPEGTVTSFKAGDPVVFKTLDHCGHCTYCYTGADNQCIGNSKKRTYDGMPGSGGLAQYICLDAGRVFPIGQNIDLSGAAFAEPLACCIHSVKRSSACFGDTVVILGAGIMGQLHALLARLRGTRTVVVEPDDERRKFAAKMGAHIQIDPSSENAAKSIGSLTKGEGADVVFVTANNPDLALQGTEMLRKMGKLVLYGSFHPSRELPIDPNMIHYSEIIMTGSSSQNTSDFFQAARMLSCGLIPVADFLYGIFPLEQAGEAMQISLRPDTYRVGIKMQPG